MNDKELAQLLMATFLEELQEHVGKINQDLLALEKDPSSEQRAELLKLLFRSAHTLKGSSRAVNVPHMESACHELEEVLTGVRDSRLELVPELFALLFETADAIEEAGMRLREDQNLDGSAVHNLIPRLHRAAHPDDESDQQASTAVEIASSTETPTSPGDQTHASSPDAPRESAKRAVAAPQERPSSSQGESPAVADPPRGPAASVRIAAEKLDALLARSGELLVARRRVASRTAEVEEVRDQVTDWKKGWGIVEKSLRQHGMLGNDTSSGRSSETALPRRVSAVLQRTRETLNQLERRLDQLASSIQADGRHLETTCGALDDEVHRVRMLPFTEACGGLERAVRDLARKSSKQIELVVEGQDVEIDRSVLEGLKDPLLHLVRNAVDHGIEKPAARQSEGKSPTARVTVSAALQGNQVEVVVADDGRGVDLERIRQKVAQKGLTVPSDERHLVRMLFHPGFSTAAIVTDVSGRGVGLDVVQSTIESLHGSVDVQFQPGQGTRFVIQVPLTLTTIRNVLAEVGGQTFGFPTTSVQQLVRFRAQDLRPMGGRPALLLGDAPIPVASLAETLGLPQQAVHDPANDKLLAVIAKVSDQRVALVVDSVVAEQEAVVKSLGRRIRRLRHVSGGTLLASGEVAFVLNVANVIRSALGNRQGYSFIANSKNPEASVRRVLVVDDSVTTRTLWKSILETAGYEVQTAVDGSEGWQRLEHGAIDLVVTDVDMPRMNGFELTEEIRNSLRHRQLPVVLVTARETEEDRVRGIQVGADAYVPKSAFDQRNLLETIAQLL